MIVNKISSSEISQKFIKSALLVGCVYSPSWCSRHVGKQTRQRRFDEDGGKRTTVMMMGDEHVSVALLVRLITAGRVRGSVARFFS